MFCFILLASIELGAFRRVSTTPDRHQLKSENAAAAVVVVVCSVFVNVKITYKVVFEAADLIERQVHFEDRVGGDLGVGERRRVGIDGHVLEDPAARVHPLWPHVAEPVAARVTDTLRLKKTKQNKSLKIHLMSFIWHCLISSLIMFVFFF